MARKRKLRVRKSYDSDLPEFRLSPQTKRGVLIVVFILLAALSFLSFFNSAGALGQTINKVSGMLFGWASVVSPLIFFAVALALFLAARHDSEEDNQIPSSNLRVYLGAALLTFSLTGIMHLIAMRRDPGAAFGLVKDGLGGGYIGVLTALPLYKLVDFWAGFAILVGLVLVSIILLFNIDLSRLFRKKPEALPEGRKISLPTEVKINNKMAAASGFNVAKVAREEKSDDGEEGGVKIKSFENNEAVTLEPVEAKFRKGNWQLPPLELLEDSRTSVDSGNIEANVNIIQKTLADFGIDVEMGEVNVGPTVTQYTLRPTQGVKLSQIAALQNDLALALAAPSIRMELPIPGKSLVGIEIPNKSSAIVRLKDIIQTESFDHHKSNLAFALGRDVAGHPVVADLARMPHLLIAGATGTGKSIAINSLMISFLYRNSPEELRLIVIDPKRVELNLYNGVPHLLTPVVSDHDKAVNALKWAVNEMDRRYSLLAAAGKRNILEYNSKAADKLPYIVIVVDELADLMAVALADVEAAIVRLAQMARAVGVHLVVATQRPSVDIITGLIKANITSRMAFAVASQVDSRTILDSSGAEKLLGNGDMLYITAELGRPKRIQGTYISEKEVKGVVEFVSSQAGEVDYSMEIVEKQKSGRGDVFFSGGDVDGDDDEVLEEAIALVRRAGKASASLLQRRLRVGYARAARMLDLMEERGVIGPADGAKPRDVYMSEPGDDYNDKNNQDNV